jgi:hypothetical protein
MKANDDVGCDTADDAGHADVLVRSLLFKRLAPFGPVN